ncbi:hypothetical protein [Nostoc sp. 'Peltigera malacea cyanobiont' DB3992]|uniref:hypothetical protein n=1 Tax=Nostoc sp. 'Peltigera malacea cyanobiont' DB3992 TaxID=1206980 RepID=UPI000C053A5B|nr:hypothetical protein [Nostoc sp. 'Peltigera malacea cyanobiont' DB3992]PHM11631.1 hypothetical protein CK516_01445 [Nostoc sp. 'Peltigera malacea cyanobiont' DB3992]
MINNSSNTIEVAKYSNCTHGDKDLIAIVGDTVLNANSVRQYAAFINNSSSCDITLILGDKSKGAIGRGIILKPRGSYEINQSNLYVGKVSAVSANNCRLTFTECVE